jgi:hypothetical protein
VGAVAALVLSGAAFGCGHAAIPDPKATALQFANAASRGDAQAVHRLLTQQAQSRYGVEGTRRLLVESRGEIATWASRMASGQSKVDTVAEVKYVDGEHASLELEGGAFRVSAASGLPAGARTPAEALEELRGALARRSYAALLRILSSDARGAVEDDMRSLVGGLDHPDTLEAKVHGETAEVQVPGGHKVLLKREGGVWRVHDFD